MPLRVRSFRTDLWISLLAAVFVAGTGRFIAEAMIWAGFSDYWAHWSDDIFTGVVAGAVVFVALRNNSAKRRLVQERLREVLEINHNIRNALDVINSSHHAPSETERLTIITGSVARIDEALKGLSGGDPAEAKAEIARRNAGVIAAKNVKRKNLV